MSNFEYTCVLKQFQSLFCWISVSDIVSVPDSSSIFESFNPCFAGFPFRTRHTINRHRPTRNSFNPCFAGFPFRTRRKLTHNNRTRTSFNPCFAGFPFRTFVILLAFIVWMLQVSILVLLDFRFGPLKT